MPWGGPIERPMTGGSGERPRGSDDQVKPAQLCFDLDFQLPDVCGYYPLFTVIARPNRGLELGAHVRGGVRLFGPR